MAIIFTPTYNRDATLQYAKFGNPGQEQNTQQKPMAGSFMARFNQPVQNQPTPAQPAANNPRVNPQSQPPSYPNRPASSQEVLQKYGNSSPSVPASAQASAAKEKRPLWQNPGLYAALAQVAGAMAPAGPGGDAARALSQVASSLAMNQVYADNMAQNRGEPLSKPFANIWTSPDMQREADDKRRQEEDDYYKHALQTAQLNLMDKQIGEPSVEDQWKHEAVVRGMSQDFTAQQNELDRNSRIDAAKQNFGYDQQLLQQRLAAEKEIAGMRQNTQSPLSDELVLNAVAAKYSPDLTQSDLGSIFGTPEAIRWPGVLAGLTKRDKGIEVAPNGAITQLGMYKIEQTSAMMQNGIPMERVPEALKPQTSTMQMYIKAQQQKLATAQAPAQGAPAAATANPIGNMNLDDLAAIGRNARGGK